MKILINLKSVLLGRALQELLEREPEAYIARAVSNISQAGRFHPDFIVVDGCTISESVAFRDTGTKIVLLDSCLSDQDITSLLLSFKIDGVLSATTDLPLFKKALEVVMSGQIWVDNDRVKSIVRNGDAGKSAALDQSFSKREREIIVFVSQGLTNRHIAEKVQISEQTVKTHLSRIFRKARISRRSQLVPLAMKLRVPGYAQVL
ncbi:MAG: response regulator transcription factor [Geobacteraceae bacterium]|nr:response regulator transcription factor [Geobacteraceae bacterium]